MPTAPPTHPTAVDPTTSGATETREVGAGRQHRAVLARAGRVWRRAGVRRQDRRDLAAELDAELTAAAGDGLPGSAVLGDDPETTLRDWAGERGLAGRALRLGVLLPVALGGVVVASAVLFADLIVAFTVPDSSRTATPVALTIVVSTAVMCVLLPTLACWALLRAGHDPRAGATARWLVAALPVGELAAIALGTLTVMATSSISRGIWEVALVALVVLATLGAAVVLARHLSVTYQRHTTTP